MAQQTATRRATMTAARLREFSAAWDRADIDAVMNFFSEDCVFHPSVEESPGAIFRGRAAVEAEFRRILTRDTAYESRSGVHLVFGDYGYCEWSLVAREDDGGREIRGCDFFEFNGDLIARKDAFRKVPNWLTKLE